MANLAGVLKEEMARLARKELRGGAEGLKKASTRHRADIAALKRRIATLEQQVAKLEKLLARQAPAATRRQGDNAGTRFSAKGLKKHRERLGLSAPALGSLLGVSAQTIYNWEGGATRPNAEQLGKIAALRRMGKREAQARLQQA